MQPGLALGRSGWKGAVATLVTAWAIAGGLVLLAVVAMNVISVVGTLFGCPFPGDFEMTEIGIAVAVFRLIAAVVALLFAALLLWRMYLGMGDQRQYNYTTAILQFEIWLAFIPILVSLALLVLAGIVSLAETARHVATGTPQAPEFHD